MQMLLISSNYRLNEAYNTVENVRLMAALLLLVYCYL